MRSGIFALSAVPACSVFDHGEVPLLGAVGSFWVLACWLLPSPIHLGLSAARRPALADKGSAIACGYLGV
jgi:hypothetical protein